MQQPAETGGGHGQQHVVHRGGVRVRDLGDQVEVGADEGERAVRADQPVQAGPGTWLLGEEFAHRGPSGAGVPQGHRRMRDDFHCVTQLVGPSPEVVAEQFTVRRTRCGCPRRRCGQRGVGVGIQQ